MRTKAELRQTGRQRGEDKTGKKLNEGYREGDVSV